MRTKTALVALLTGMNWVVAARAADQLGVRGVLNEFQSVRPTAADLAIYQLDWVPTLKAAKEKAAREQRPIFLVVVRNSFGNICSGHC
jgi:hypothetical protein